MLPRAPSTTYSLRVESIRGDLPRIEDLPRSSREKLCLEERRGGSGEEVGKVGKILGKESCPFFNFYLLSSSKLDDETWPKVAERMQEAPIIFRNFSRSNFFNYLPFDINYPLEIRMKNIVIVKRERERERENNDAVLVRNNYQCVIIINVSR